MQLRAALARRTDQHRGESLVERHRDERRLSVSRYPLDADALRIHRAIRLEIVQHTRRAPRPGPEGAPVVGPARLSLVRKPGDAACEPRTVVGLDARRI